MSCNCCVAIFAYLKQCYFNDTVIFVSMDLRKVWQAESLVNLVNRLQFAKLKPSKVVVTINNHLADLFVYQTFSAKE